MANILALTAGDWHTGSNWEGGVVPSATDVAILNGKVMTLVSGASITCSSIEGGTALESLVSAIKAKTDKLMFDSVYQEADSHISSVVFISEFETGNYSTESGQTGITLSGSTLPAVTSTTSRTGMNSLAFSDSNAIQYVDEAGFNFGADDFTIELSVKFNEVDPSVSNYAGVIGKRTDSSSFQWSIFTKGGFMHFLSSGTNAVSIDHTTALVSNTWYDVAVSKSGNNLRMFVNGVVTEAPCPSMVLSSVSTVLFMGRLSSGINSYYMNGNIDRVRLTKGVARYDTTPPTYPPVDLYPTTDVAIPLTNRVLSTSIVTEVTDYTARFDTLDTGVTAIKAKTDLLTFGSTGVVTEDTSGGGIDYTSRFDDLDVAVAAIPTLTYTARLNSIDTDLGNLIANNMRNSLVAGVVSSTDFIGLLDDTSAELSGGTPAYQREAVVWSSPFNGIVTNTTDITINVPAGGTVAYIAGYTLVAGGIAQFSYACTEVDAVVQSVYTIPAGTLQMTTTVQ